MTVTSQPEVMSDTSVISVPIRTFQQIDIFQVFPEIVAIGLSVTKQLRITILNTEMIVKGGTIGNTM